MIICLLVVIIALQVFFRPRKDHSDIASELKRLLDEMQRSFERIEKNFREDFRLNREEGRIVARDNREELTIIDSDGNKNVYKVELAQTKEELSTGLMNRTALDADSGMVFDLSDFNNVPTAMWMKDTKIALDMLFIDRDGMIYWIFENAEPDSVKMIVAPYPATAVLEIKAGDRKAKGI